MDDPRVDHLEICPACGGYMVPGHYLCRSCEKAIKREGGETPKLVADKPEIEVRNLRAQNHRDACDACPMKARCRERVINNLWVLCEIPDELDLEIAQIEMEAAS